MALYNGVNGINIDLPNVATGNLEINGNPRNGQPYFNTSLFTPNPLGTQGNASRRFFFGPGMDKYDMRFTRLQRYANRRRWRFAS
jgi:hypothetical protein